MFSLYLFFNVLNLIKRVKLRSGIHQFWFLNQNYVRVQIFTCITYSQADLQPL